MSTESRHDRCLGLLYCRQALFTDASGNIMNLEDRIVVDPSIRSGKPCIRGTRIAVYDVLEYLAGGMSETELLHDFPDLSTDDIRAVLAFAAARERRLAISPAA